MINDKYSLYKSIFIIFIIYYYYDLVKYNLKQLLLYYSIIVKVLMLENDNDYYIILNEYKISFGEPVYLIQILNNDYYGSKIR